MRPLTSLSPPLPLSSSSSPSPLWATITRAPRSASHLPHGAALRRAIQWLRRRQHCRTRTPSLFWHRTAASHRPALATRPLASLSPPPPPPSPSSLWPPSPPGHHAATDAAHGIGISCCQRFRRHRNAMRGQAEGFGREPPLPLRSGGRVINVFIHCLHTVLIHICDIIYIYLM